MNNSTLEWRDASKMLPKPSDYNKSGYVIVAYEDGNVDKGFVKLTGEWAFKDRYGKAMYWTPYPDHPKKEETLKRFIG